MTSPGAKQNRWTQKDIDKMKSLLAAGNTFSQIATALGDRFSRSAVIGKAKRLGVSSAHRPGIRSAKSKGLDLPKPRAEKKPPAPKPSRKRILVCGIEQIAMSRTDGPAQEKTLPRRAEQAFDPLPGVELVPFIENTGCRWPCDGLHGKGLFVCGAARVLPASYCDFHNRLSYNPRASHGGMPAERVN